MNNRMETLTKPRELFVPNTLKDRPAMFDPHKDDVVLLVLTEREFYLLNEGFVFEDINDRIGTLIGGWEEEEISFDNLDAAMKVVEARMASEDNEERLLAMEKLFKMLRLAKEKQTLLGLYL